MFAACLECVSAKPPRRMACWAWGNPDWETCRAPIVCINDVATGWGRASYSLKPPSYVLAVRKALLPLCSAAWRTKRSAGQVALRAQKGLSAGLARLEACTSASPASIAAQTAKASAAHGSDNMVSNPMMLHSPMLTYHLAKLRTTRGTSRSIATCDFDLPNSEILRANT